MNTRLSLPSLAGAESRTRRRSSSCSEAGHRIAGIGALASMIARSRSPWPLSADSATAASRAPSRRAHPAVATRVCPRIHGPRDAGEPLVFSLVRAAGGCVAPSQFELFWPPALETCGAKIFWPCLPDRGRFARANRLRIDAHSLLRMKIFACCVDRVFARSCCRCVR